MKKTPAEERASVFLLKAASILRDDPDIDTYEEMEAQRDAALIDLGALRTVYTLNPTTCWARAVRAEKLLKECRKEVRRLKKLLQTCKEKKP